MSELISGKDALIALTNGESVMCRNTHTGDVNYAKHQPVVCIQNGYYEYCGERIYLEFFIKHRTITLNVEIEKPKEIFLCAITGAVGLVYGDLDKAKATQELLREVFK